MVLSQCSCRARKACAKRLTSSCSGRFWQSSSKHADAQGPIEAWHAEAEKASWRSPQELKTQFRSASVLKGGRVVFNIAGNKYRLVVAIDYERQACFVKFIGTHEQYDQIDAETVQHERSSNSN
jgi:mRNA interferase HigB